MEALEQRASLDPNRLPRGRTYARDGTGGAGLELGFEEDCARWASSMIEGQPAPVDFDVLAKRTGIDRRELFRRALAWRSGGRGGLDALLHSWEPPSEALASGRQALGPGARATANRVSLGDRQLRLGRDGRWYPYRKARGTWLPEGEPVEISDGA